jgi:cytochrome c oxidase cbb3-type subunit I
MMKKAAIITLSIALLVQSVRAEDAHNYLPVNNNNFTVGLLLLCAVFLTAVMIYLYRQVQQQTRTMREEHEKTNEEYLHNLDAGQIDLFLNRKNAACCGDCKKEGGSCSKIIVSSLLMFFLLGTFNAGAQTLEGSLFSQPGIIIMIVLTLIPVVLGVIFALIKVRLALQVQYNNVRVKKAAGLATYIKNIDDDQLEQELAERKIALSYSLTHRELAGTETAIDAKGGW